MKYRGTKIPPLVLVGGGHKVELLITEEPVILYSNGLVS